MYVAVKWRVSLLAGLILGSMTMQAAPAKNTTQWVGTWAASPMASPLVGDRQNLADTTFRDIVHISLGGSRLRLKISNEFGTRPLLVGGVHLAVSVPVAPKPNPPVPPVPVVTVAPPPPPAITPTPGAAATTPPVPPAGPRPGPPPLSGGTGGEIRPGTDHPVTFGGQNTITIAAGSYAISDPVAMEVPAMADLAVSIFVPAQTVAVLTSHQLASSTNYSAAGSQLDATALTDSRAVGSWMLLKGIDVEASEDAGVVVTLGDSITDGARSTRDGNTRWPDVLAARLHANPATARLGVLNEGISGNRVIRDGAGVSALARFDRDVLSQSGVKYIIFLEGINDIGVTNGPPRAGAQAPLAPDPMTAADLIWALNQLVMRAHARGIKVYGATLTAFGSAGYQTAEGEKIRLAENDWIRNGGAVDGVIDFSKTTKDPSVTDASLPEKFLPAYDSGDHLHPNDTGYKAMGDSIDLKLFVK